MPRHVVEVSETNLKKLLADGSRKKRRVVALANPRGLVVRLDPGKQSSAPCYLTYRLKPNGKVSWLPLGIYPEKSLEELRVLARKALDAKADGKDPRAERERREKAAQADSQAPTMSEALDLIIKHWANPRNAKPSTAAWGGDLVERIIRPYWGKWRVEAVTRNDIKEWRSTIEKKPFQADACIRVLSKTFMLAIDQSPQWIKENPCFKIGMLVKGEDRIRKRILDEVELRTLAATLRTLDGTVESAALGAIRALLFSAMRLREVLSLRWDEVDFKKGFITKTDHKTSRKGAAKKVVITPQLKSILDAQKDLKPKKCPWVFPSPIDAANHFIGLQKVWDRIRKHVSKSEAELVKAKKKKADDVVNIEDVHLHDLRRTALSILAGDLDMKSISTVAGHASTVTTEKVYAHLSDQKQRIAADKIAAAIEAGMAPVPTLKSK